MTQDRQRLRALKKLLLEHNLFIVMQHMSSTEELSLESKRTWTNGHQIAFLQLRVLALLLQPPSPPLEWASQTQHLYSRPNSESWWFLEWQVKDMILKSPKLCPNKLKPMFQHLSPNSQIRRKTFQRWPGFYTAQNSQHFISNPRE
jgi:hypothetical protein